MRGNYKNETGQAAPNMKKCWATGAAQPRSAHSRDWTASASKMQGPGGPERFTYGPTAPKHREKKKKIGILRPRGREYALIQAARPTQSAERAKWPKTSKWGAMG